MAKFNVRCPHCYEEQLVSEEWYGMEMECSICKNRFVVESSASGVHPRRPSLWQYFWQTTFCQYSFEGRACRKEYWGFELFWGIIFVVKFGLLKISDFEEVHFFAVNTLYNLLFIFVLTRRLHDLGKSAKNWIIAYLIWYGCTLLSDFFNIPSELDSSLKVINQSVYVITTAIGCIKGNDGDNEFGKDPLRNDIPLKKVDPLYVWIFFSAMLGGVIWKAVELSESYSQN